VASTTKSTAHRELGLLVEKQMRNWEIARAQRPLDAVEATPKQPFEHFISLSRSAGLPGFEVAQQLGDRLGWPVFNRDILREMAENDSYRERLLQHLDQKDETLINQFLRSLTEDRHIGAGAYCRRLRETVVALARKRHAIFVGRGTDLFLPKDVGLRVRLIAGHDYCVRSYAAQKDTTEADAERCIDEIERERAKFLRHYFKADSKDPIRHDLLINMERFDQAQTVEMIMAALRLRGIVK